MASYRKPKPPNRILRVYKRKYTKEFLEPLVAKSLSIADVMRCLGLERWSGGTHNQLVDRIREYGLDSSHFKGQGSNCGQNHRGGTGKKTFEEVLVRRRGTRQKRSLLRRAMQEAGILYKCFQCGGGPEWQGQRLTLEVDHKNGDRSDDRQENVRFACPNCHSQTETYGRRNVRATMAEP